MNNREIKYIKCQYFIVDGLVFKILKTVSFRKKI